MYMILHIQLHHITAFDNDFLVLYIPLSLFFLFFLTALRKKSVHFRITPFVTFSIQIKIFIAMLYVLFQHCVNKDAIPMMVIVRSR